jgi:lysophospholipase L1-like esterase
MMQRRIFGAVGAAMLLAAGLPAQTRTVADPYAGDPTGIVADPCPAHPGPEPDYAARALHSLTRDFGQLCRYRDDNRARLAAKAPVRVVFMGDSITDNWQNLDKTMFTGGLVDRGISGQTTPQMLVRFREDVVALRPQAVHIMAGTNDIAGNTGAATIGFVEGTIQSMAELARAHGIKVILASVPPAGAFPWAPDKRPVPQIAALNAWAKAYAAREGFTWVDYTPVLANGASAMKPGLSSDGVHPTAAGYAAMKPLALAAVRQALGR